eukprot:jgi/Orpsp1_1/1179605/evm.model.c7180000070040.1
MRKIGNLLNYGNRKRGNLLNYGGVYQSYMKKDKEIFQSIDKERSLAYCMSNVPVLNGFYTAHTNHYPIRIKPDDIWLLIVQAFSNHVNSNAEELRNLFVNFNGKQTLSFDYDISNIEELDKNILENFSVQINKKMEEYLGKDLLDTLTPNFSTTTPDLTIISKISIMGAFKKYFKYEMNLCGCGIPYIILEGTAEDYKKIIEKAKVLSKYKLEWYIERIIPHIQKMVDAKEGIIDIEFFKNMIQKKEIIELVGDISGFGGREVRVERLYGWFLSFFAYLNKTTNGKEFTKFYGYSIDVKEFMDLANQMLVVPFKVVDQVHHQQYDLAYKVGFIGCDQNEKNEVFPVQGWFIKYSTIEERNRIL